MTAQETFAAMLKERVAPALRELGFVGSGNAYELRVADHWAMLGFQKSTSSSADRVNFTVNLLVVSKKVWERDRAERPYLGKKPNPNVTGGQVWTTRLGQVLPGAGDQWWVVGANQDTAELADALMWAIRDFGIPAMKRRIEERPDLRVE